MKRKLYIKFRFIVSCTSLFTTGVGKAAVGQEEAGALDMLLAFDTIGWGCGTIIGGTVLMHFGWEDVKKGWLGK